MANRYLNTPVSGESPEPEANAADRLGTEPVGALLLRFSVPAITGMLVNALYNVVDRIFVGRGVNETALGGLALVLPLMTIVMAFAMLFGMGAANMISMRLGQQRREEAENALNHCFWLLTITALIMMGAGLIFMDPLLSLLGAQEGSRALDYARRYYRIILYGSVFGMLSFGFSHCTRAQGFPRITMLSMFIGAGLNMILDPLFIFLFHWGVEGAAWATVISQCAAAVWILGFNMSKHTVIRLQVKRFKPQWGIIREILAFGSSQFLLQFVMSAVQLLYNISMGWYGAAALGVANGGDIALSGMNIVMSVSLFILMPIFGINQGLQPILGYNYGAKRFDRVRSAYLRAIGAATGICLAGFLLVQFFPHELVRLFTPEGSAELLSFTPMAMRIALLMLPVNGFQIVSANVFVVTGRPKIAIVLSLLRQCIVLIPCMLLFGRLWGLSGVIASAPVADGFSLVLTSVMIYGEMQKLRVPRSR
ncbi:MAG: MATE family efflux transporter [Spirochaetaceae bacterium]|nr:MATE family efflux transporter [Spirochaetaceae bacterium]